MTTTNVSFRCDTTILERIDQAALREGQTRTEYILSWLPAAYEPADSNAKTSPNNADEESR